MVRHGSLFLYDDLGNSDFHTHRTAYAYIYDTNSDFKRYPCSKRVFTSFAPKALSFPEYERISQGDTKFRHGVQ